MSRYLQGKLTQNCTRDIVFDNRIVPKYCCKKLLFFSVLALWKHTQYQKLLVDVVIFNTLGQQSVTQTSCTVQ